MLTRQSSVDFAENVKVAKESIGELWFSAYYATAIIGHAQQHLRNRHGMKPQMLINDRGDFEALGKLRNARTDLKAVMEYLHAIEEVSIC